MNRRRVARAGAVVAGVTALACAATGFSLARLSSQVTQSGGPNRFTGGTVTLTTSASVTCNLTAVAPGDSSAGWFTKNATGSNNSGGSDVQCTLPYTYSGTSAAYLGLDLTLGATAGTPQTPYSTTVATGPALTLSAVGAAAGANVAVSTSSDSGFIASHPVTITVNGVSATIVSGGTTDANGGLSGAVVTVPASLAAGAYSIAVSDGTTTATSAPTFVVTAAGLFDGTANGLQLLIQDSAGPTTFINGITYTTQANVSTAMTTSSSVQDLLLNTTATASRSGTITVDYYLPNAGTANNAYQAAATTVTLTIHAVQAANQTAPGSLSTPCVVGRQCLTQTGFGWS